MMTDTELDYRYTLTFPVAKLYRVDDVLTFISKVVYRTTHPAEIAPVNFFYSKWGNPEQDNQLSRSINPESDFQIKKTLDEYKLYLIDRIFKEVSEGKFELWDWAGTKVIAPPINSTSSATSTPQNPSKMLSEDALMAILDGVNSTPQNDPSNAHLIRSFSNSTNTSNAGRSHHQAAYQTRYWWAIMASILKSDLVKFCTNENILVKFEDKQELNKKINSSIDVNENATINCDQVQEMENSKSRHNIVPTNTIVSSSAGIERSALIPGKVPKVGAGKLAVKAAWEIECESGRPATPEQVIERLQTWAKIGNDGCLLRAIPLGVKWITKRTRVEKDYTIGTCVKTLEKWKK